jgi:predicted DNA-binding protein
MKQTDPQYKLRLPQELKDQIETAAKEAGRSMNAEIVARLEESFSDTAGVDNALLHMLAEQQTATIKALEKLTQDLVVELHQLRKDKK